MGFFKKLKKGVKKGFKQLGSDIAGGLDLLSAGFSHPIMTFKDPVGAVKKTRQEGAIKTIGRTIRTTALGVGAILLPTKTGLKTAGGFIAKKPIVATAGLVGLGAATTSSKARKTIDVITDPSTPFVAGQTIGKVAEGKRVDPKKALATGGVIGGAAALVGGGLILKEKVKGKFKTLEAPSGLPTKDVVGSDIPAPSKASLETPVSAPTKPSVAKKEAKPIKVSQNVDVRVRATGITKRFKNTGVVVEA